MNGENSIFNKFIIKKRSIKFFLGIITLFITTLVFAVLLDGEVDAYTQDFSWRGLLIPPTIIIYILTIAPFMSRMETDVFDSLQNIFIDQSRFQVIVKKSSAIEPISEWVAIGFGCIIGVISAFSSIDNGISWVSSYWLISNMLLFGLLSWTIYVSIKGTRLISTLLRQPLDVDPFNTTPFQSIGRQSLMIAVVFIGGITISLMFIGIDLLNINQTVLWLVYMPLAIVPVVLFFLNMLPTHKVLADAKNRELIAIRSQLQISCRKLLKIIEEDELKNNLADNICALSIYQKQLNETPTWPYNTGMLRTLFFSVLIPVGTLLGRILIEALRT
jgi:hypothetical protein